MKNIQPFQPSLLPIAYCLLPIAYCLLPIAYCLLPIAYPIAYCLLPTMFLYFDVFVEAMLSSPMRGFEGLIDEAFDFTAIDLD